MIQNIISKFSKKQAKKDPLKFQKIKKNIEGCLESKSVIKTTPPKEEILIQNNILKFSKTKNLTQKGPSKVPKNQKHI